TRRCAPGAGRRSAGSPDLYWFHLSAVTFLWRSLFLRGSWISCPRFFSGGGTSGCAPGPEGLLFLDMSALLPQSGGGNALPEAEAGLQHFRQRAERVGDDVRE